MHVTSFSALSCLRFTRHGCATYCWRTRRPYVIFLFVLACHSHACSVGSQSTDPHCQLILYNVLLSYGRRNSSFLRSHKRWQPIIPLLMDHVRLDIDPDVDAAFPANSNPSVVGGGMKGIAIPIEAKLRLLSTRLLYEVCRVQKLSLHDLRMFPVIPLHPSI